MIRIRQAKTLVRIFCLALALSGLATPAAAGIIKGKPGEPDDNRQLSKYLDQQTYLSKVGYLTHRSAYLSEKPHQEYISCTATLVAPTVIVTAASCVEDFWGLKQDLYFVPGWSANNNFPKGRYPVLKSYIPLAYKNGDRLGNDIAFMELGPTGGYDEPKTAGQMVGNMGFWGKVQFTPRFAMTIGFPLDKPFGQYFEKGCEVKLTNIGDRGLRVECDMMNGQQGSPLLFYDKQRNNYYLEGVMSEGGLDFNYGSRITPERQRLVSDIRDGKFNAESLTEKWQVYEHERSFKIGVLVRNACDTNDLLVARHFKDTDGNWQQDGFFKIVPNETVEIIRSNNRYYYLNAHNANKQFTRNDVYKTIQSSGSIGFQEYHASDFIDQYQTFGCF